MKKIILILLSVLLLLSFFTPIVFAEHLAEQKENTATYKIVWEGTSLKLVSVSINLLNFPQIKLSGKSVSIKIFISGVRHKDPTLGIVENLTKSWEILFFIDGQFAFRLLPGERIRVYLDIGAYSIRGEAYVGTFFGRRLIGVFNFEEKDNLEVDGIMLSGKYANYGWRVSPAEINFEKP